MREKKNICQNLYLALMDRDGLGGLGEDGFKGVLALFKKRMWML